MYTVEYVSVYDAIEEIVRVVGTFQTYNQALAYLRQNWRTYYRRKGGYEERLSIISPSGCPMSFTV